MGALRGRYDAVAKGQNATLLKYIETISSRSLKLGVDNLNRLSLQNRLDLTPEHQRLVYGKTLSLPFLNGTELYSLADGLSIVVFFLNE